jgi:hypothetical protein
MKREGFFPARDRRPIHLDFRSASVALLLACGAQTAGAQTAPLPQATLQQLGAPSVPAGYCKQFTLTGPIFLNMVNTIVNHGDLTDIAFLEKALGTKFRQLPGLAPGTDLDNLAYKSDQVLGSPLPVQVIAIKGKEIQSNGSLIGEVRFQPNTLAQVYFMRCLMLTSANFVSLFGPLSSMWLGGVSIPIGVGHISSNTPGKMGSRFEVSFGWSYHLQSRPTLQTELVSDVNIMELQ